MLILTLSPLSGYVVEKFPQAQEHNWLIFKALYYDSGMVQNWNWNQN